MMNADTILQPVSRVELIEALGSGDELTPIAGGTDVIIRLRAERYQPARILDLSHLDFMREIQHNEEGLLVGAACTMTRITQDAGVISAAPALATAASSVGSGQIRNLATIGGNVAMAAQCADTIPVLVAYNALAVMLDGHGNERREPVETLVHGIGKTSLGRNEILTSFIIPKRHLGLRAGFGKIGSRKAVTIAKINGAGIFEADDGEITYARIAFGSIGVRAFLAAETSTSLIGMKISQLMNEETMDRFSRMVEERIGNRPSVAYKKVAVKSVLVDIIRQAFPSLGVL